jgi:hypothetical protein
MMVHTTRLIMALFLALCPATLQAASSTPCAIGRPVTIEGKISSVTVREERHWSIWLDRKPSECAVSALILDAQALPSSCRPRNRVMATGIFDGSDTVQTDLKGISCTP